MQRRISRILSDMRRWRAALLLTAALAFMPADLAANPADVPMVFKLQVNTKHTLTWISAIGTITEETPAKFETFKKSLDKKGLWIVFHSPGGLVVPALRLGKLIRDGGFRTDVAFTLSEGNSRDKLVPGACLSACAYAFLGGVERDIQEGSLLGYHRFYMDPRVKPDPKNDAYAKEVLTKYLEHYVKHMGIGPELLDRAMATDPTDYYEPTEEDRIRLRIITVDVETDNEDADEDNAPASATSKPNLGKHSMAEPLWFGALSDTGIA
jgi:hypothetical protein